MANYRISRKGNLNLLHYSVLLISGPLLSLLAMPAVVAGPHHYEADLGNAMWLADSSIFECRITQSIPSYGEAVFYQLAGTRLLFKLKAFNNLMETGRGTLLSVPPDWKKAMEERDLGFVDVVNSPTPVTLDASSANRLMTELLEGRRPTFARTAHFDQHQAINVGLSPVNFAAAYSEFQTCVATLLPVNFAQVERTSIFWKVNQMELDAQDKRLLDNIVLYSKADPSVASFEVDGFTDTEGERLDNLRVSEQRAFQVTNYLVSKGIDPERIATRAHGEREEYLIVQDEKTAADRDRNRRVNVVLIRN